MGQKRKFFSVWRWLALTMLIVVFAGSVSVKRVVHAKTGTVIPKLKSKKEVSLKEGGSSKVKVSGKYIVKVTYSSSDKRIAVVSKKGKITAKGSGSCKVKAKVSYRKKAEGKIYKKSFTVTVKVKHEQKQEEKQQSFTIRINGQDFTAKIYNTQTGREFYEKLPKTITMSELNGNEKYYYADTTFTTDEKKIDTIKTGDLMLYGDNCIVLFYDTFRTNYKYTRIGYIENPEGLAKAVGSGKVKVSFLKN